MSEEFNRIETIARGVCVSGDCVLICRNIRHGNRYFPGGHIEFGETGAYALEREMMEEAGVESRAVEFLGCAEHIFVQNGTEDHAEINLVYALDIPSVSFEKPVEAKESWIAFDWVKVSELAESDVEPAALRKVAAAWFSERAAAGGRLVSTPGLRRR